MSVGVQISKGDIDNGLSGFSKQLNYILTFQVEQFFNHLEALTDTVLQAPPYSYTVAETAQLRSAYRDLFHLAQVFQGLWFVASGATAGSGVPTANDATHFGYDFRTFLKLGDQLGY